MEDSIIHFSAEHPNIDFENYVFENLYPRLASEYRPPYVKTGPVSHCPGIQDLYSRGYVIPICFNFRMVFRFGELIEETPSYRAPSQYIQWHSPELSNIKPHFESQEFYERIVKIYGPWSIRTEPGVSLIQCPMWYEYGGNLKATPGIIESSFYPKINVPFFIRNKPHLEEHIVELKEGDPLCIVYPFKNLNVESRLVRRDAKVIRNAQEYVKDFVESVSMPGIKVPPINPAKHYRRFQKKNRV